MLVVLYTQIRKKENGVPCTVECFSCALLLDRTFTFRLRTKSTTSAVAEMGDRGHNRHGPKRGGLLFPFRGRSRVPV